MSKRYSDRDSPKPGCSKDPDNYDGVSDRKRARTVSSDDSIAAVDQDENMVEPLMAGIDEESKWTCAQCTYANFETSTSCTMCRTGRDAPCMAVQQCMPVASSAPEERWECTDCTYMNVLKALRCSVCSSSRPSKYNDHKLPPLLSDENIDLDEVEKVGKALRKWDCLLCTYKNWPTAKCCNMCGTEKDFPFFEKDSDDIVESRTDDVSNSSSDDELTQPVRIDENIGIAHMGGSKKAVVLDAVDVFADNLNFFENHIIHLKKCVDTGCASFLEVCYEILHNGREAEKKLYHYIYRYGVGNRRLNAFESKLLISSDKDKSVDLYNMSLLDLARNNASALITNVPHFFTDSMDIGGTLPGLGSDEQSNDIYKTICDRFQEDYEITHVFNDTTLFVIPNAICELRPWILSGDNSLRVLMDFDDRVTLKTICCMDTFSLMTATSEHYYTPMILRNRGGGHSLVDAVSQALWGVVDKTNTLRNAIFRTLYSMETIFRGRWAAFLMKIGMNFDIWFMQRHWANIMNCSEPGSALEQVHIMVLAQVLNRAIIVFPIDSMKSLNVKRYRAKMLMKHPVEGFYAHIPGANTFRLCPPILLGYGNGNYHALVLPPRPAIEYLPGKRSSKLYRYVRCPTILPTHYVQFALNESEAEEMVKDIVVDIDANGQQWIYHSTYTPHPKITTGTVLWVDWIRTHFPNAVRDDCLI